MNISDNSYYEILNRLRYFADNHYLINSFTHGQRDQMDISKSTAFPTMHVVPSQFTRSGSSKLYSLDIIFADLPRMKDDKPENQMEVISDCDRLADDLVNEIKNGNTVFGNIVDITGDMTTEPFIEEDSNVLTGVVLRLSIAVPYTWNACDVPGEWVTGDGTEPQFGTRDLTLDVYDEGEFEVAARSIDFIGSGVAVTHEGNRAIVTISGGGGGGAVDSVNGQTGTVVLDAADVGADASGTAASAITTHVGQIDPHTQYALESSLGAVATTNDYNDLDNIPNLSGYGDMFKSTYDTDDDGIVDSAKKEMVEVINKTGATLTKGTIVYLKTSSSSGTHPEVLKAAATTEATSSKTIGAIYTDIANDATGYVVTSGEVNNLDTSSYAIGDRLWLSTTAGQVTTTVPAEPNHSVFIGTVTRSQNTNGRVLYAIQNGYELDELHGVSVPSPSTNDVLYYASDGIWKNKALSKSDVGLGNVDNTSDANKPISNAVQTALDLKANTSQLPLIYKSTTDSSAITGTTGITLIRSVLIPANTFSVGDVIRIRQRIRKVGGNGLFTAGIYINTSNSVSGAAQLGIYTTTAITHLTLQMKRDFFIKSATVTEGAWSNITLASDDIFTTQNVTNTNRDWTVDQYIVFTVNPNSSLDSFIQSGYSIEVL